MAALPHRRQVFLFLVAVLFPSAVLVALGLRMIEQERELAEQRVADNRRRAVSSVRDALRSELLRIQITTLADSGWSRSATRAYAHPSVRLVARVENGEVVPPWEAGQAAQISLMQEDFVGAIARGERAEFGQGDLHAAIELYRGAARAAQDDFQLGYAQLLLARALTSAGRARDAEQLYETLLALPSPIADDLGLPLAFYAANVLLGSGRSLEDVYDRVRREIDARIWHGPAAAYLLRDIVAGATHALGDSVAVVEARELADRLQQEIADVERVLELQRQFLTLALRPNSEATVGATARWVLFGEDQWLVTVAPTEAGSDAVLALDATAALASIDQTIAAASKPLPPLALRVVVNSSAESLGQSFPGLGVAFLEDPSDAVARAVGPQRALYLGMLFLVLSITFFGGYLLLRDVRRETRLAGLRSHFVSSVSHELKTPLTSIRMFAETLRTRAAPDPTTQAEYLDTIVGESERLTRLLNNVLDHSKIEQDKKIYRPEPASLEEITSRAAAAMEYPLSQGGFTLHVDAANGLPPVPVDSDAPGSGRTARRSQSSVRRREIAVGARDIRERS